MRGHDGVSADTHSLCIITVLQSLQVVSAVRAGMVHSFLQRPSLVDRSIKQSALKKWLERIRPYANEKTIHGKTNLHHQVRCPIKLFARMFNKFKPMKMFVRMFYKFIPTQLI